MRTMLRLAALALCALAAVPAGASAVALDPIAPTGTYASPTFVTSDPANPNRIFVVERAGLIKVTEGATTSTFADLSSLISCCGGERGLLSMAVPPDYPETGRFFVAYTEPGGDLTVSELHASGGSVPAQVPRVVLSVEHSTYSNHNGGQLQLGPDGFLYVSVGDGGGGDDPFDSGQSTTTLLGKILRIDPASGAAPAAIPANPFANPVWSYGLRNPWRFSFDRGTGDLLIADVGQGAREEIDYAPASSGGGRGANFGWDCREGLIAHASSPSSACAGASGFTDPIFDYPHADPGGGVAHGCSITGGYVVRDPSLVGLYGRYLYADYCVGELRSITPASPRVADDRSEGLGVANPTSFGEDGCGRIYVASNAGPVSRLEGPTPAVCHTLSVTVVGAGRLSGGGMDCPGRCHVTYPGSPTVQLTGDAGGPQAPIPPQAWSGECAGSGATCTLTMDTDRSITVTFPQAGATRARRIVTLRAATKEVRRGRRATLEVTVGSCQGSAAPRVSLRRDGEPFGSKLSRDCRAVFHPRIRAPHRFRAVALADQAHLRGASELVRILLSR